MERITIEVNSSIAKKWQQASLRLKKQAVKAFGQLLDEYKPVEKTVSEEERKVRVEEARKFFSNLSADFTGYKFNREEANER